MTSIDTVQSPSSGNMPDAVTSPPDQASKKSKSVISSPYLHRIQRRHFVLFDVLPFIGTVAAIALLFFHPITSMDIALFFGMWLATGLALTAGYHRLFAHGAFATSTPVAVAFIILGAMAGRGSMISWVTTHRRHHHLSDKEGDIHSPNLAGHSPAQKVRGWLHAHFTWMIQHDYPNPAVYAPDLLRNPVLLKANRYYHLWVALGLALPAVIGGLYAGNLMGALTGFLWGGVVRMFVVEQSMSTINSFLHLIGSRPFDTRENSRNAAILSLPLWGEAWHNNHHAFPYSAAFGLTWYQLDPGYWLIRGLQAVGLVWDVKIPIGRHIAARRGIGA